MEKQQTAELLDHFLQALISRDVLAIPQETVLGAITHFLSTLPLSDLPRFTTAILDSDYLWGSEDYAGGRLIQAVGLSVSSRVAALEKRHTSSWCAGRKVIASCRHWLEAITTACEVYEAREMTKLEMKTGLLVGIAANEHVVWGDGRMNLEEEIVLGISELGLSSPGQRELGIICDGINHIEASRLRILDLEAILPFIQNALLESLDQLPRNRFPTSKLSVSLGRIFEVLAAGSKRDRALLWVSVRRFVNTMKGRAEADEGQRLAATKISEEKWKKYKSTLFAFLVPSSRIIDILIKDLEDPATEGKFEYADLSLQVIATLAAFSVLTQLTEGGLEGDDRVLFGSLDILVAQEGTKGVQQLFEILVQGEMPDARAAFVLRCGELVVDDMSNATLVQQLLPLAQSYLHQPEVKAAFEAAHAFISAVVTSVGRSDVRPLPQAAFAAELAPYYTGLLIRQFTNGSITADRFKTAYPPTIGLASKVDDGTALNCIDQLDALVPDSRLKHTVTLARIGTAQYIPINKLRSYLDRLADDIADTPAGDERLELAANAFGMVVRELGDQQKRIGIDWWLERKSQIEGNQKSQLTQHVKAKL